ncbi:MAG: hypothetical protein WAW63_00470 [Candidatus Saccharimonadales bacterium]|nr:hypothetical protein [Candidatus Saccharibacteria bacterium]
MLSSAEIQKITELEEKRPPLDEPGVVYHITDRETGQTILDSGFDTTSAGEAYPLRHALDEVIDTVRPKELVHLGVSHTNNVFAHARPLDRLTRFSLGAKRAAEAGKQPVVLSISVDPEKIFVFDAGILEKAVKRIGYDRFDPKTGALSAGARQILELAGRQYWSHRTTLADYYANYKIYGKRREGDFEHPYNFEIPEVLIPVEQLTEPEQVSWVVSILIPAAQARSDAKR